MAARPLDLLLTYRSCWCAKVARLLPLFLHLVTLRHEGRHPRTKMGTGPLLAGKVVDPSSPLILLSVPCVPTAQAVSIHGAPKSLL